MDGVSILNAVIYAVVSGVIGGTITGLAAFAAIRVKIDWLRSDMRKLDQRLSLFEKRVFAARNISSDAF